jgi:hypothetical protein
MKLINIKCYENELGDRPLLKLLHVDRLTDTNRRGILFTTFNWERAKDDSKKSDSSPIIYIFYVVHTIYPMMNCFRENWKIKFAQQLSL